MEKIAIMYDFDNTLSVDYMQNYGFFKKLHVDMYDLFNMTNEFSKEHNMDGILCIQYIIQKVAKENGIKLTKKFMESTGKNIEFFAGVESWFDRINEYALKRGFEIEHYIISSGQKEIIEGCKIAKFFKGIFANEYLFDENTLEAITTKQVVNYTSKTQYIFRIKKGLIYDLSDAKEINKFIPNNKLNIPYKNMIYIGDGETDVPCMTIVKDKGGLSIGLYNPNNIKYKEIAELLYQDSRVNLWLPADYTNNGALDKAIKKYVRSLTVKKEQVNANNPQ